MKRWILAALLLLAVGCARHVVLEPEDVARLNEQRWTVTSEPKVVVAPAADAGPVTALP